ncbi:helix-turn-helix domain-containing protein [Bacillus carboniphilus]|uniref:Helix-turn-helix domain-containing protein n=1 Tax=Bacillus carboniphilus TaxID=86663 RepID=A0ABY9JZ39_9BACI|nr:helix-turn-helix domain-containing protein [Bacillus carboniphilus]WLR43768.1 helix-turn-helix domain-containing protein [Bacillus carboniphilus]
MVLSSKELSVNEKSEILSFSYLHVCILYCLNHLDGQRTVSAVLHILNGKKSSQTIQDSYLFKLTNLFGVFMQLTKYSFIEVIIYLEEQKVIDRQTENSYILTTEGKILLGRLLIGRPMPNALEGLKYQNIDRRFWNRLALYIQSVSHIAYQQSFQPVMKDRQQQTKVKNFLLSMPLSKQEIINQSHKQLHELLSSLTDEEALLITFRLSVYNRAGLTNLQLGDFFHKDKEYIDVWFWATIHKMIESLSNNQAVYPLLYRLMEDFLDYETLTQSTRKTLFFYEKGYTIEQISTIRKLKTGTIEDHFVELAFHLNDFEVEPLLSEKDYNIINNYLKGKKVQKLSVIKEDLHNQFSFFQIRLALAKLRRAGN